MGRTLSVYISQPMTGCDPNEIHKERAKAEEAIEYLYPMDHIRFLNGYNPKWDVDYMMPLEALARSLYQLCDADVAYFVSSWKSSKGCQVERLCCELYGIRIIDEASD